MLTCIASFLAIVGSAMPLMRITFARQYWLNSRVGYAFPEFNASSDMGHCQNERSFLAIWAVLMEEPCTRQSQTPLLSMGALVKIGR